MRRNLRDHSIESEYTWIRFPARPKFTGAQATAPEWPENGMLNSHGHQCEDQSSFDLPADSSAIDFLYACCLVDFSDQGPKVSR